MKTIQKILLGLALAGTFTAGLANGADIYKKCASCHGSSGEKKALGRSAVIQGWDANKTIAALKGYKDGTYGGPMKGLMKGQVAPLSDEDIEAVAKYIQEQK